MHNKETYTHVYTPECARIDIRVYARTIRVCVVQIVLSCTVTFWGELSWKVRMDKEQNSRILLALLLHDTVNERFCCLFVVVFSKGRNNNNNIIMFSEKIGTAYFYFY